jgi:two-component system capsular synthesis response regulator RcsB
MFIEGVCAVADKASVPTEIMHAVQASMAGRRFMSESLRDPELPLGHTGTSIPDKLTAMPVLSPCEADILRWLARGWIVSEIARHTRRSVKTISQHKQNAMRKLGVTCDYALFEYMLAGGALGAPAQQRAAVNTSYDPSIRTA